MAWSVFSIGAGGFWTPALLRRPQGDSRNDILRVLKRYIARETFNLIIAALRCERVIPAAA